jgi:hypothetical protein
MHDRFSSYDRYPCQHSVCAAHLLRDCLYLHEQEQQGWALEMHELLLDMSAAASEWHQCGALCIPAIEREEWVVRYFEILAAGFAVQPPLSREAVPKQRGRQKQSAAKNLLDDLTLAGRPGAGVSRRSLCAIYEQSSRTGSAHGPASSKRLQGPFAAKREQRPFVTSAVICQQCASKAMRCLPLWPPSLQAHHSPLPGHLGSSHQQRRRPAYICLSLNVKHVITLHLNAG